MQLQTALSFLSLSLPSLCAAAIGFVCNIYHSWGWEVQQDNQQPIRTRQPTYTQQSGSNSNHWQRRPTTVSQQCSTRQTTLDNQQPNCPDRYTRQPNKHPTTYNQQPTGDNWHFFKKYKENQEGSTIPLFPLPTHNPASEAQWQTHNAIIFLSSKMWDRPRLQNSISTTQTEKATPSSNRQPMTDYVDRLILSWICRTVADSAQLCLLQSLAFTSLSFSGTKNI